MNDLRGILLFLMLLGLPFVASVNLECRKHFICANKTYFNICADFGDGKLRAIEGLIYPCPPGFVCEETNIHECQLPLLTTTILPSSTPTSLPDKNTILKNILEAISVTTPLSTQTSDKSDEINGTILPKHGFTTGYSKIIKDDTTKDYVTSTYLITEKTFPVKTNDTTAESPENSTISRKTSSVKMMMEKKPILQSKALEIDNSAKIVSNSFDNNIFANYSVTASTISEGYVPEEDSNMMKNITEIKHSNKTINNHAITSIYNTSGLAYEKINLNSNNFSKKNRNTTSKDTFSPNTKPNNTEPQSSTQSPNIHMPPTARLDQSKNIALTMASDDSTHDPKIVPSDEKFEGNNMTDLFHHISTETSEEEKSIVFFDTTEHIRTVPSTTQTKTMSVKNNFTQTDYLAPEIKKYILTEYAQVLRNFSVQMLPALKTKINERTIVKPDITYETTTETVINTLRSAFEQKTSIMNIFEDKNTNDSLLIENNPIKASNNHIILGSKNLAEIDHSLNNEMNKKISNTMNISTVQPTSIKDEKYSELVQNRNAINNNKAIANEGNIIFKEQPLLTEATVKYTPTVFKEPIAVAPGKIYKASNERNNKSDNYLIITTNKVIVTTDSSTEVSTTNGNFSAEYEEVLLRNSTVRMMAAVNTNLNEAKSSTEAGTVTINSFTDQTTSIINLLKNENPTFSKDSAKSTHNDIIKSLPKNYTIKANNNSVKLGNNLSPFTGLMNTTSNLTEIESDRFQNYQMNENLSDYLNHSSTYSPSGKNINNIMNPATGNKENISIKNEQPLSIEATKTFIPSVFTDTIKATSIKIRNSSEENDYELKKYLMKNTNSAIETIDSSMEERTTIKKLNRTNTDVIPEKKYINNRSKLGKNTELITVNEGLLLFIEGIDVSDKPNIGEVQRNISFDTTTELITTNIKSPIEQTTRVNSSIENIISITTEKSPVVINSDFTDDYDISVKISNKYNKTRKDSYEIAFFETINQPKAEIKTTIEHNAGNIFGEQITTTNNTPQAIRKVNVSAYNQINENEAKLKYNSTIISSLTQDHNNNSDIVQKKNQFEDTKNMIKDVKLSSTEATVTYISLVNTETTPTMYYLRNESMNKFNNYLVAATDTERIQQFPSIEITKMINVQDVTMKDINNNIEDKFSKNVSKLTHNLTSNTTERTNVIESLTSSTEYITAPNLPAKYVNLTPMNKTNIGEFQTSTSFDTTTEIIIPTTKSSVEQTAIVNSSIDNIINTAIVRHPVILNSNINDTVTVKTSNKYNETRNESSEIESFQILAVKYNYSQATINQPKAEFKTAIEHNAGNIFEEQITTTMNTPHAIRIVNVSVDYPVNENEATSIYNSPINSSVPKDHNKNSEVVQNKKENQFEYTKHMIKDEQLSSTEATVTHITLANTETIPKYNQRSDSMNKLNNYLMITATTTERIQPFLSKNMNENKEYRSGKNVSTVAHNLTFKSENTTERTNANANLTSSTEHTVVLNVSSKYINLTPVNKSNTEEVETITAFVTTAKENITLVNSHVEPKTLTNSIENASMTFELTNIDMISSNVKDDDLVRNENNTVFIDNTIKDKQQSFSDYLTWTNISTVITPKVSVIVTSPTVFNVSEGNMKESNNYVMAGINTGTINFYSAAPKATNDGYIDLENVLNTNRSQSTTPIPKKNNIIRVTNIVDNIQIVSLNADNSTSTKHINTSSNFTESKTWTPTRSYVVDEVKTMNIFNTATEIIPRITNTSTEQTNTIINYSKSSKNSVIEETLNISNNYVTKLLTERATIISNEHDSLKSTLNKNFEGATNNSNNPFQTTTENITVAIIAPDIQNTTIKNTVQVDESLTERKSKLPGLGIVDNFTSNINNINSIPSVMENIQEIVSTYDKSVDVEHNTTAEMSLNVNKTSQNVINYTKNIALINITSIKSPIVTIQTEKLINISKASSSVHMSLMNKEVEEKPRKIQNTSNKISKDSITTISTSIDKTPLGMKQNNISKEIERSPFNLETSTNTLDPTKVKAKTEITRNKLGIDSQQIQNSMKINQNTTLRILTNPPSFLYMETTKNINHKLKNDTSVYPSKFVKPPEDTVQQKISHSELFSNNMTLIPLLKTKKEVSVSNNNSTVKYTLNTVENHSFVNMQPTMVHLREKNNNCTIKNTALSGLKNESTKIVITIENNTTRNNKFVEPITSRTDVQHIINTTEEIDNLEPLLNKVVVSMDSNIPVDKESSTSHINVQKDYITPRLAKVELVANQQNTNVKILESYTFNVNYTTEEYTTEKMLQKIMVTTNKIPVFPDKAIANETLENYSININNSLMFDCSHRSPGKFADKDDCRTYYICVDRLYPVVKKCPEDTVFSDISKKCTKDLSHCIRNNEFQCTNAGRFSDIINDNYYFICVLDNLSRFVKFKFHCQGGFHLNKSSVKCVPNDVTSKLSPVSNESDVESSETSTITNDQRIYGEKTEKDMNPVQNTRNQKSSVTFDCRHKNRGQYADHNDCKTYYVCIGKHNPLTRKCPEHTVYSELENKCTKNLSHCIRYNEFICTSEGKFIDILKNNSYYICVKYNVNHYLRFHFKCEDGFHLDKSSTKCTRQEVNTELSSASEQTMIKTSEEDNENPRKQQTSRDFECDKEGKFSDPQNCQKYYVCSKKDGRFRKKKKKCQSDEVFHKDKKKCVSASTESDDCV